MFLRDLRHNQKNKELVGGPKVLFAYRGFQEIEVIIVSLCGSNISIIPLVVLGSLNMLLHVKVFAPDHHGPFQDVDQRASLKAMRFARYQIERREIENMNEKAM